MAFVSPISCTMSLMSPFSGSSGHASFRFTRRTRFATSRIFMAAFQA